jgi:hypothetical protein
VESLENGQLLSTLGPSANDLGAPVEQTDISSNIKHTFLWTVDAESAHSAERFMIELQWSVFNALKIVPLGRYQNVVEACKKLDAA